MEYRPGEQRPIIVIDDEVDLRRLAARWLERAGLAVREAGNGEEGWTLILEYEPYAIVLDVRMPLLDGISLTRRIRGDERTRDVAIVLLTASVEAHDKNSAMLAGADAYLQKPCTRDQLLDAVRAAVAAHGHPDPLAANVAQAP